MADGSRWMASDVSMVYNLVGQWSLLKWSSENGEIINDKIDDTDHNDNDVDYDDRVDYDDNNDNICNKTRQSLISSVY